MPPPAYWSKKQPFIKIEETMTEEEKREAEEQNKKIAFNNRIACNRKTYFFGYVYPKIMAEYKRHKKVYNDLSIVNYGMSLEDLKASKDKSPKVKKLINGCYNYAPLFNSSCTMNILAKHIEDIEFKNKKKDVQSNFDWRILLSDRYFVPDKNILLKLKNIVNKFNKLNMTILKDRHEFCITEDLSEDDFIDELTHFIYQKVESEIISLGIESSIVCDNLIYLYYNVFKKYPRSLLWNIFSEQIVNNVKKNKTKMYFPIESEDGESYLGKKYKLIEVDL